MATPPPAMDIKQMTPLEILTAAGFSVAAAMSFAIGFAHGAEHERRQAALRSIMRRLGKS